MKLTPSSTIPGVVFVDHDQPRRDQRGSFSEVVRASAVGSQPFVQQNVSESSPGVLRGIHYHFRQADLWCFERGAAAVVLVDLRGGRVGGVESFIASPSPDGRSQLIYIPEGVGHGFRAGPAGARLRYLVTREYDEADPDEHGLRWNDPEVVTASDHEDADALWWGAGWDNPAWSAGSPILSGRDAEAPFFAAFHRDMLDRLRHLHGNSSV